jgi:hypothetical protein
MIAFLSSTLPSRDVGRETRPAGRFVEPRHETRETIDLSRASEAGYVADRGAVVGRAHDRDARDRGQDLCRRAGQDPGQLVLGPGDLRVEP